MQRSRIFDLATEILAAVQTGLATEGVEVPGRAYVSAGAPAFDLGPCDQLAVWLELADRDIGTSNDINGFDEDNARWLMRVGRFVVTLNRCSAVLQENGEPPSVEEEQAAAQALYGDATSIVNAVMVSPGIDAVCHGVSYAGLVVIGPSGGTVAAEVRFDVSLTGLGI